MNDKRRVFLVILDGVGCGELPDAADYGDVGSNTLGNLSRCFEAGLRLPNLGRLGLGDILEIRGVPPNAPGEAQGNFGKCCEVSKGKDSTTGHWEIAGLVTERPLPTYPNGFPREILRPFEEAIGRGVLGNKASSGTVIIEELGEEHLRTGKPIVYTSADSVFQIAAHASVYSEPELYEVCKKARAILSGEHAVGRVIARPFVGDGPPFTRTAGRHDFALEPRGETLLDKARAKGIKTVGVGKIGDLFAHRGLCEEIPTQSNPEGIEATLSLMGRVAEPALVMTNLVEFDQNFGHRNDCDGYRAALEGFDERLPDLTDAARPGDMLILTSDHGVDPTTPSTDHSREYTPLLVWGPGFVGGVDLGVRKTFADIGQTICDYLGIGPLGHGTSFLGDII